MSTQIDSMNISETFKTAEEPQNNETVQSEQKTKKVEDLSVGSPLECGICYEEADEPVTTMCGHIYCWACVYKWLQTKSGSNKNCPECKSLVTEDKLIPLYPKNYLQEKKNSDKTDGVPKRPYAKREGNTGYKGFGSSLFTGVNIRMQNVAVTIGCLPAVLPMILFVVVTLFGWSDDSDGGVIDDSDYSDSVDHHAARNSEYAGYQDDFGTDAFDWTVILLMIAFVSLPFILRRFRRN